MTKKAKPKTNDRRSFLKNGLALAGGAALVVAAGPGRARAGTPAQPVNTPERSGGGYRETPHVLEYYRLAKL